MPSIIGKKIDLISVSLYFALVFIGWLMILSVEADGIDLNAFSSIFGNSIVRSQSIWIVISWRRDNDKIGIIQMVLIKNIKLE